MDLKKRVIWKVFSSDGATRVTADTVRGQVGQLLLGGEINWREKGANPVLLLRVQSSAWNLSSFTDATLQSTLDRPAMKISLAIYSAALLLTLVAPSMAAPDACKVFKPEDATPFLKQPATKTGRPAAGDGCRFETADGSYLEFSTLSGDNVDFAYNSGLTGPSGPRATVVLSGVGDKAKMAIRGNGVIAVKGKLSCGVSGGGVSWKFENDPAEEKAQAQKLAALCMRYFAAS
jgi:hypothetical protein